MADAAPEAGPQHSLDEESLALFGSLSAEQEALVRQLVQERDHLFLLHEAYSEVRKAATLEDRLRIFVNAIRRIGFGRVVITLRDAGLEPTSVIAAGLTEKEELELRVAPASGDTWRRRLSALGRFRVSESYYLDGRDEWVRREFRGGVPSTLDPGDDPDWSPGDSLIVPLRGLDGRTIATLVLDDPVDRHRPSLSRIRAVELFAHQMAYFIEETHLAAIAQRRSDRLQLIHDIGGMLSRSLDEMEIVRELARQLPRVMKADAVVVARPDEDATMVVTMLRSVRGKERPRAPQPIGRGPLAEVIRSSRAVRISEWEPSRVPLAASDDVVGDGGPVGSLLAVPMMAGIEMIGVVAVYTAARNAYAAEEEEVLHTIAGQAATALLNARLFSGSEEERRQSEALAEVTRAVSGSLQLSEVMDLILRHAVALTRAQGAGITMGTVDDEMLEIVATIGSVSALKGMKVPQDSMTGRVIREGTPAISNDTLSEPDTYMPTQKSGNVRKILYVPLLTARGAIGVLAVINRPADFTDTDARVLQRLADQVAVAIVNARLFGEVETATREWAVAFDAITSAMVVLDKSGRVTRGNVTCARLVGAASKDDVVGFDFHELLLGHEAEPGDPVKRTLQTGLASRATIRAPERGRVYDVVASPHPDGGAVVTFDDVSLQHTVAERYRRVVETTSDAIVITDRQRKIRFVNPAAVELFGIGPDIVGRDVDDLVPAEHREEVAERERLALTGMPQRYETGLVRGDGERRLISVSTAPLREVGEAVGIVATLRDVTEERRARDAVALSEARYRNLFESASDAIYTMDLQGIVTSVNEATSLLAGVPRAKLLGRKLLRFVAPDEVERITEHFLAARAGEARHYEVTLVVPNSLPLRMSVTNTPIRRDGQVVGVLGIARDITADLERAEALSRSEAQYSRLVESAADAIFTLDERGLFTSVNRALEEATGLKRDALLGRPFSEVVDPRDRDSLWQVMHATIEGTPQRGDLHFIGRQGVVRAGSITTTPIFEGGKVVGALGIVRDITEQKRLTEQLLQQEKLVALGQLVSGVAHELNNPLAGVIAFSQLLLASADKDPERKNAIETIHLEAKRAAKIVANLLTFARQHKPQRTDTDINQVLLDTLELRRYALRMEQIDLEIHLDQHLPKTWADPFQLQQVFLNLIGNAEQAMSANETDRKLRIGTRVEGSRILISVSDTGEGIPAENIDRIFNPFYTTKPVGQGTGLGLSISDGIVRAHGGTFHVESRPGHGATFIIELPLVQPPEEEGSPHTPSPRPVMRPQVILMVDNERPIRSAVSTFLSSGGHAVDSVGSAAEALSALATRKYDIVLLDLRLPDMSGEELYQRIMEMDASQARRVIFLAGDLHSESAREFVARSGRRSIRKPFQLEELTHLLAGETGER